MSVCTWFNYIPKKQGLLIQIEYKPGYPTAVKPAVHPSGDGERDPKGCLDIVDNQPLHKIRDGSMCMAVGGSLAPLNHSEQVMSIRINISIVFCRCQMFVAPLFYGFPALIQHEFGNFSLWDRPISRHLNGGARETSNPKSRYHPSRRCQGTSVQPIRRFENLARLRGAVGCYGSDRFPIWQNFSMM